jgi:hypothetical protein
MRNKAFVILSLLPLMFQTACSTEAVEVWNVASKF